MGQPPLKILIAYHGRKENFMRRMTNFWAFIKKLAGLIGFTGNKIEVGNDLEVDGDLEVNSSLKAETLTDGTTTKTMTEVLAGGGGGGLDIDLTKGVNLTIMEGTFTGDASAYIDTSTSKALFTAFGYADSNGNLVKFCKYDITLTYITRTDGTTPDLIYVPVYMKPRATPTQYGWNIYMMNTEGASEGLAFSTTSTIRHYRGLRFSGDTRRYIGYYKI